MRTESKPSRGYLRKKLLLISLGMSLPLVVLMCLVPYLHAAKEINEARLALRESSDRSSAVLSMFLDGLMAHTDNQSDMQIRTPKQSNTSGTLMTHDTIAIMPSGQVRVLACETPQCSQATAYAKERLRTHTGDRFGFVDTETGLIGVLNTVNHTGRGDVRIIAAASLDDVVRKTLGVQDGERRDELPTISLVSSDIAALAPESATDGASAMTLKDVISVLFFPNQWVRQVPLTLSFPIHVDGSRETKGAIKADFITTDLASDLRKYFLVSGMVVAALLSMVGYIVIVSLNKLVLSPMNSLELAARDIEKGTFSGTISVGDGHGEISDLARKLEVMGKAVQDRDSSIRALLELAPVAMRIADKKGGIVYLNERFVSLFGYSLDDIPTVDRWFELAYPDTEYRERVRAEKDLVWSATGGISNRPQRFIETSVTCKNGEVRETYAASTAIDDFYVTALVDMTGIRQTQRRLLESEERFLQLTENLSEVFWIVETDWSKVHYVSSALSDMTGLSTGSIMDTPLFWLDFVHEDDVEIVKRGIREMASHPTHDYIAAPFRLRRPNGALIWVGARYSGIRNAAGETIRVAGIWEDLTDSMEQKRIIEGQEKDMRILLDTMPVGCIVWNPDFTVALWNRAAEEIFGYSAEEIKRFGHHPLEIQPIDILVPADYIEQVRYAGQKILGGEDMIVEENVNITQNGRRIVCEWKSRGLRDASGRLTGVLSMITDLTNQKRLQDELVKAQKMKAIGELAGSVAHDFNNMLAIVMGYADTIVHESADIENAPAARAKDIALNARKYGQTIMRASEKASNLTKQLLAFSRRTISSKRPLSLNREIDGVLDMIQRLIGSNIVFSFRTSAGIDDLVVEVDPVMLERLLLNMAANAKDAMPDGGQLSYHTSAFDMDEVFIAERGYGQPGHYAKLTIQDTGKGIPNSIRPKIFEPFFSTKPTGKGGGLGLAIVYSTVKDARGYIDCFSEAGSGAAFEIYLPLSTKEPEISMRDASFKTVMGTETILVAEDDPDIRALIKMTLEAAGYTVVMAVDGAGAVSLYKPDRHDLLLFDIVMPKKNGRQAYQDICAKCGECPKTVFMSGYDDTELSEADLAHENVWFLSKPVRREVLLDTVRRALDN